MKYRYLIFDSNNFGYKVMARSLDRTLIKVSNKFIYPNFIKAYIESVETLKNTFEAEELIFLFDNHSSKEELRQAFSSKQGVSRRDIKETYKANRRRETKEFYDSLDFIKYYYLIGDKNYHTVQIFKLEADDLVSPCIKTIVKDDSALLITNDSDWTRYLKDTIHYFPEHEPVTKEGFQYKYGFKPSEDKVVLYKILYGDSADNIDPVFPEFSSTLKKQILDDFDSIFDILLEGSTKPYLKEYIPLIKDRETQLKINYQLLSAIPVSNEQFLSHYTTGRGSEKLKVAINSLLYGEAKTKTPKFKFGGLKVPRVQPKEGNQR